MVSFVLAIYIYEQQQSIWNSILRKGKDNIQVSDNTYLDIEFAFNFMNHSNSLLFGFFDRWAARLRWFIFCRVKRIQSLHAHYAFGFCNNRYLNIGFKSVLQWSKNLPASASSGESRFAGMDTGVTKESRGQVTDIKVMTSPIKCILVMGSRYLQMKKGFGYQKMRKKVGYQRSLLLECWKIGQVGCSWLNQTGHC